GPTQTVRLRFSPSAARYVREKTWHPSQQLVDLASGGVDLSFRINQLAEVKRWVLSFGADCEVIEPQELNNDVTREVARMSARSERGRGVVVVPPLPGAPGGQKTAILTCSRDCAQRFSAIP